MGKRIIVEYQNNQTVSAQRNGHILNSDEDLESRLKSSVFLQFD